MEKTGARSGEKQSLLGGNQIYLFMKFTQFGLRLDADCLKEFACRWVAKKFSAEEWTEINAVFGNILGKCSN